MPTKKSNGNSRTVHITEEIQISDDSTSSSACLEQKLVMQFLTNNVLTYNATY